MDRKYMKPKFRTGMAVGLEELREDESKARDLMAELLMEPGYIGYIDASDPKMRVYVFRDRQSKEKMLQFAKKLELRTAGSVLDAVHVRNEDLQRPHMRYISKDVYYKELYK